MLKPIQSVNQSNLRPQVVSSSAQSRGQNTEIGLLENIFSNKIKQALKGAADFAVVLGPNNQTYLILPEVDMIATANTGRSFVASA